MVIMEALRKPYKVDCIQYDGTKESRDDWCKFAEYNFSYCPDFNIFMADTENGVIIKIGDYLVKNSDGEIYVCNKKAFEKEYEIMEIYPV